MSPTRDTKWRLCICDSLHVPFISTIHIQTKNNLHLLPMSLRTNGRETGWKEVKESGGGMLYYLCYYFCAWHMEMKGDHVWVNIGRHRFTEEKSVHITRQSSKEVLWKEKWNTPGTNSQTCSTITTGSLNDVHCCVTTGNSIWPTQDRHAQIGCQWNPASNSWQMGNSA